MLAEQRSLAGLSARVLFPAHAQLAEPDSQHDCSSKAAGLVSVDCGACRRCAFVAALLTM